MVAVPAAALAALALAATVAAAEPAPAWLREALARDASTLRSVRGAVVLHAERHVVVRESGRMIQRERQAIRVLTRDGLDHAIAPAVYRTDAGRVKSFAAWIVSPAGVVSPASSRLVIDVAALGDDLYNEIRVRYVDPRDVADGGVVACEWTIEQDEPFAQEEHGFQSALPTLVSRYVVEHPEGWSVSALWRNHVGVVPESTATRRAWALRDLAEIPDEPWSPGASAVAPRLAVTVTPAAGARPAALPGFTSWNEVARWLDGLAGEAGGPDAAVRQSASRVAFTARTELDTLRSLGRFVQDLRYASIQMGLGRGGGYRPRPPSRVLERGYGDCKDKANLLRALLGAVGRRAHLVAVHHGDRDAVRVDWPSPVPFNHCIAAIELDRPHGLAAEVEHPRLGRLLVFDPTDPGTPLGDLPAGNQGGLALIVTPDADAPVRLPALEAGASTIDRRIELVLDPTGAAAGTLLERCRGQAAVVERMERHALDRRGHRDAIAAWLRRAIPDAEITTLAFEDDTLAGRFETRLAFTSRAAVRRVQERLYVLRPPVLSRMGAALAADRPRRAPIELRGRAVRESLVVTLPAELAPDELPAPAAFEGPGARFEARTEAAAGRIAHVRSLTVEPARLPRERYGEVREFFARVRAVEDAPIVLVRP